MEVNCTNQENGRKIVENLKKWEIVENYDNGGKTVEN